MKPEREAVIRKAAKSAAGVSRGVARELLLALDEAREERDRARELLAFIISSNERGLRDPLYEAKVREIGAPIACGAIMRAAHNVWTDYLGGRDGAHTIAPALPVLRAAISSRKP